MTSTDRTPAPVPPITVAESSTAAAPVRVELGFFEDDEPVRDVVAAFEAGERGRTAAPVPPAAPQPSKLAAELERVTAELHEALSTLAEIGDSISPTGERPEEALGTLAADVRSVVDQRDDAYERGVAAGRKQAAADIAEKFRELQRDQEERMRWRRDAGLPEARWRANEARARAFGRAADLAEEPNHAD